MEPFDSYQRNGRDGNQPLGRLKGGNARHGYGYRLFTEFVVEPRCAYCGLNFMEPYENWLLLTVDHVIPRGLVQRNGRWASLENIGQLTDWIHDAANCVICCSACNGFHLNILPDDENLNNPPKNWEEFREMRDRIFLKKQHHAIRRHRQERDYWNKKWRRLIVYGNAEN
ncbi:hypothetical protein KKG05_11495 [bacterium]|nr:hypothetical protein [bacterium]